MRNEVLFNELRELWLTITELQRPTALYCGYYDSLKKWEKKETEEEIRTLVQKAKTHITNAQQLTDDKTLLSLLSEVSEGLSILERNVGKDIEEWEPDMFPGRGHVLEKFLPFIVKGLDILKTLKT